MKIRSFLTLGFMIGYSLFMILFGSYSSSSYMDGTIGIFLWLLASFVSATVLWGIWNLELRVRERQSQPAKQIDSIEKKKRDRLDSVIRDLSDEELLRLRRRLLDGTVDDDIIEQHLLGEDGELLYRGQR